MSFTAGQAKNANYACAALSMVILATRLVISRRRRRPLDLSFYLVILSIIVMLSRIIVVYFYLLYGTASDAIHNADYFDTHDMDGIKRGSILSLVARVLITASCWLQICLLLLFYTHIMAGIRWVQHMITISWLATGITFIAVVLATFLECRPLHLYWQCISNIVLDLLLLAISWPILVCRGRSWKQHTRVGTLFILGTFCIIVTTLRLVSVYDTNSAQPTRSLWASVQMVVSTFVANAPTIYGDLEIARRKKTEPIIRRMSRPELWGSDAEAHAPVTIPERVVTTGSQDSAGSSRKEWFDHLEDVESIKWSPTDWKQSRPHPT